jgi:heme-degrading monooxygenase HmoA
MYLRMVWGRLKPGAWEGYERFFRERTIPQTRDFPGLSGRLLLRGIDGEEEGVSLTVWETQEDLENYESSDLRKSLAQEIQDNYATSWSYITGEYWVRTFEIRDVTQYGEARQ